MKQSSKIIGGIALLAFGVVWTLELLNLISINLDGWWAFFIIIPCFVGIFHDKHKSGSIICCGIGILLLLAARNIIQWDDIWKYMICLMAVVFGISLLFFSHKNKKYCHCHTGDVNDAVVLADAKTNEIDVSFGKQEYSYSGQHFEGAEVHTSFGFVSIDLRGADIMDGAVLNIECSFGGVEIRVDKDVCVKNDIGTAFAGVECNCNTMQTGSSKTIYTKGHCSFGGIEIK